VLPELGLEPRLILLEDPPYLELTQRLVGPECKILVGTMTSTSSFVPALLDVRLGLIDGVLTISIVSTLEGLGLDTLYYTKRLRRKILGWNTSNSPMIHHAAVGGVTRAGLRLGALTRGKCTSTTTLPPVAPRDASTVLSVMPNHYTVRSAPQRGRHIDNGECVNLGTELRSHYHGRGWLPAGLAPATRVLPTPGIYAPKGMWGLRPITFAEFLGCQDVPEGMIRAFGAAPSNLTNSSLATMVARKILVAGFRIFNGGGLNFDGSRRLKRATCVEKEGRKEDGSSQIRRWRRVK
jgi:hypothetical protein